MVLDYALLNLSSLRVHWLPIIRPFLPRHERAEAALLVHALRRGQGLHSRCAPMFLSIPVLLQAVRTIVADEDDAPG